MVFLCALVKMSQAFFLVAASNTFHTASPEQNISLPLINNQFAQLDKRIIDTKCQMLHWVVPGNIHTPYLVWTCLSPPHPPSSTIPLETQTVVCNFLKKTYFLRAKCLAQNIDLRLVRSTAISMAMIHLPIQMWMLLLMPTCNLLPHKKVNVGWKFSSSTLFPFSRAVLWRTALKYFQDHIQQSCYIISHKMTSQLMTCLWL